MFDPMEFLEKYQSKSEVTERSTDFCGWCNTSHAPNGVIVQGWFTCNKWRECENCYRKRRGKITKQLSNTSDDTVVVICDSDTAKKLLRKRQVSAEDYFRSPLDDGTVAIAISEVLLDEIGFDDYLHIYDLKDRHGDMQVKEVFADMFTEIPQGYRTSGNLGKTDDEKKLMYYEEPKDEADTIELLVSEIITETSEMVPAELFEEATILTSTDKHRYGGMDIKDVYAERQAVFEMLLERENVPHHVLRRSIKLVSRSWMESNFVFITKVENVQITSNIDLLVLRKTCSQVYYNQISGYAEENQHKKPAF